MYSEDMFLLKGILGIIFGLLFVVFPNLTLGTFFTVFGLFIFAAGILAFLFAVTSHPKDTSVWFWLSLGILAVGLLSLIIPGIVAFMFALIIAGWAFVTGIFDLERIITGTRYYYYLFLGMAGSGVIVLVAVFYLVPASRLRYLETTFGVFVFVFGIFSVVLGALLLKGRLPGTLIPSDDRQ
jgi:uncharacterized membrane protein HdeD (DUF308 family)